MIRRGIGVQSFVSAGGGTDADAQAFITAAGITDATQQSAINTLVTDLKSYGIWSKMKAIYPFVGGTSSTHKWNLKDPRDLDAAFRLVFSGGWTHSSTGALPGGINGYADTFFIPSTSGISVNSNATSFYSGSNLAETSADPVNMGAYNSPSQSFLLLKNNTTLNSRINGNTVAFSTSTMRGFFIGSKTSTTLTSIFLNSTKVNSGNSGGSLPNGKFFIGTLNEIGVGPYSSGYVKNDFRFASIGDGLTDTEAANLYTAVQAYQTTLGRSVGTQTVSDSDAQAFVNAAVIEDQVQATAINTLVTDLKGYGIWSKMKAIYPFVGGTSSSHKWNLKDPRDLDAAFRLVFSGGWTHSSTGATPNGTNGYADTFLIPSTSMNSGDGSVSYYSRTLTTTNNGIEMGCYSSGYSTGIELYLHYSTATPTKTICTFYTANGNRLDAPTQNSNGFFTGNRVSNSLLKLHRNGTSFGQNTTAVTLSRPNTKIYLGASNIFGTPSGYSTKECAFASIGDGLTDTEAANLYTAVQAYQTTLSRNV